MAFGRMGDLGRGFGRLGASSGGAVVPNPFAALITNAQAARTNNVHVNAVMSSPPTIIAEGTTAPAWATQDMTYTNHAALWRLSGGALVTISGFRCVRSAVIAATGGNLSTANGANASCSRERTILPAGAQKITFKLRPSTAKYRFAVKLFGDVERYVDYAGLTTLATSGATYSYITMDFGAPLTNDATVMVEGEQNHGFDGAFVEAGITLKAPAAAAFSSIMLGDSYVYGSLATRLNDAMFRIMADCLGFFEQIDSGSAGTGWATTGNYRFDERIPADITTTNQPFNPDHVGLMASINDRTLTQATIQANALTAFQAARAALPNTLFTIYGCAGANSGPAANVLATEASIKAAFDAWGDRKSVFVAESNNPALPGGSLITGTGKTTVHNGTGTAPGQADFHVANDSVHLVDPGGVNTLIGTDYAGQYMADQTIAAWRAWPAAPATSGAALKADLSNANTNEAWVFW